MLRQNGISDDEVSYGKIVANPHYLTYDILKKNFT